VNLAHSLLQIDCGHLTCLRLTMKRDRRSLDYFLKKMMPSSSGRGDGRYRVDYEDRRIVVAPDKKTCITVIPRNPHSCRPCEQYKYAY